MATRAPRRTQAERRADTERGLIKAAISLFAEQGFTQTSMAQIGEKAGYSRGIVRERFGSKLGLVGPLVEAMKEGFAELLVPDAEGREGLEAVLAFVDRYLDELDRSRTGLRAVYGLMAESLSLLPELRPTFRELDETHRNAIHVWIEQGIEAGEIADLVEPRTASFLIVSIVRGAALQYLVDGNCVDLDSLRSNARRVVKSGLGTLGAK
jgi:AcrR family transcriptional regulator